jgi:hypothetical protein
VTVALETESRGKLPVNRKKVIVQRLFVLEDASVDSIQGITEVGRTNDEPD